MDSGNSDSFQSSNGGGDEEYNSHGGGATISTFINPPSTTRAGCLMYNPPLHHQSTNQPIFDPLISNYQTMQNNMLLNNNLDVGWSKTQTSEPNCTSSDQLFTIPNSNISSSSSVPEIMNTTNSRTSSLPFSELNELLTSESNQIPKLKKRTRASRRAPTTVLTTDTTNFRAMVQEFTGIPAPPFTSSSSSLHLRNSRLLDNIFGTPSSMRTNPLDYSISLSSQPPPYKVQSLISQTTPSMFCASMVDSLRTNVDDSYQRLQSSSLFTMQNPILASLLQSNPPNKPSLCDNSLLVFESRTSHGSMQIQSSNGVMDEFGGLGQGLVDKNGSLGLLPGLVSADPGRWEGGGNNNGGCDDFTRNVANRKRLKRMVEDGGVGATNQGIMETWICSSTE